MLAAEIRINLGLKALVCLADIFLSAAADDNFNFGLEVQYFQRCYQGCHTCNFESWWILVVLLFDELIFLIRSIFHPRAASRDINVILTCTISDTGSDPTIVVRWPAHLKVEVCTWILKELMRLLFKMSIIVNRFKLTSRCFFRCPLLLVQLRTAAAWIELQTGFVPD